jgi:4-hydroxy-4-methyl-2-oxoglutarate aldolase
MLVETSFPVSGDAGVGSFEPADLRPADFRRLPSQLLDGLRGLSGLSATASDVLDEFGLSLAIPSELIGLRTPPAVVVGQALTVRYLPERRAASHPNLRQSASRLAHHSVFETGRPGDVLVVEVAGLADVSVLGGIAAQKASSLGIAGCVVDGGIRDLEQIRSLSLPVWSRRVTPKTGKWRVEAAAINRPIACGGIQVQPGDLVIADETGVCLIPVEVAEAAIERILQVGRQELEQLSARSPAPAG